MVTLWMSWIDLYDAKIRGFPISECKQLVIDEERAEDRVYLLKNSVCSFLVKYVLYIKVKCRGITCVSHKIPKNLTAHRSEQLEVNAGVFPGEEYLHVIL